MLVDNNCVDEDECVADTDDCTDNALCENTEGSYECVCMFGFEETENGTCSGE